MSIHPEGIPPVSHAPNWVGVVVEGEYSTPPTLRSDDPSPRVVCTYEHSPWRYTAGESCTDLGSSGCSEGPWYKAAAAKAKAAEAKQRYLDRKRKAT
jgi:hypothetical protein